MDRIHLGAWGETIFTLRKSRGLEGDKLLLQQRDRNMSIGEAEIRAIMAIGEAFGMKAYDEVINRLERSNAPTG